jgi:hypothetical protein
VTRRLPRSVRFFRHAVQRCAPLGAGIALVAAGIPVRSSATTKETFSIDYIVTISRDHPDMATVRWELAGIDEINHFVLRFRHDRVEGLQGSGALEPLATGAVRWTPNGPYAHLTYRVPVNHPRGKQHRFDSYAGADWVVTRARDVFPRTLVDWSPRGNGPPRARARLQFRLPPGWQSATTFPALETDTYLLNQSGQVLSHPRGWFALGRIRLDRQEIGGTMLQVARAPGSSLNPQALFRFLEATLPALQHLLLADPETLLLVSAPDPMWRGGISAEHSFYVHGDRPLRTPDKTSPYLHELFHVLQPFKPGADADWIAEGLAEFYSLELQRRAGLIDAAAYVRALGYFQRFGLWNVDLTRQRDNAATNNSAPLVMYALDQRIQRATTGKKRLDDVVTHLAQQAGVVGTQEFRHAVEQVSGKPFNKFFEHQVFNGIPPSLANLQ